MRRSIVQVIWSHPRTDSRTATVAGDVADELRRCGLGVEVIDIYRSGMDPSLREPDEPDWNDLDKQYSLEVMDAASRSASAAAVVFDFPVWWFSMPAALKGYIDRVWNFGIFYGSGRHTGIRAVRWIALAGDPAHKYTKRGYDQMMAHHLNVGIAGYCGIVDSQLELLYNTFAADVSDVGKHIERLRGQARSAAGILGKQLSLEL